METEGYECIHLERTRECDIVGNQFKNPVTHVNKKLGSYPPAAELREDQIRKSEMWLSTSIVSTPGHSRLGSGAPTSIEHLLVTSVS